MSNQKVLSKQDTVELLTMLLSKEQKEVSEEANISEKRIRRIKSRLKIKTKDHIPLAINALEQEIARESNYLEEVYKKQENCDHSGRLFFRCECGLVHSEKDAEKIIEIVSRHLNKNRKLVEINI